MTLCETERPLVSKILKVAHPHFTNGLMRKGMFRRFIVAILSILISGLKLMCNMLSLLISRITKQEMPLFGMNVDEVEESIERSKYLNRDWEDGYDSPIKY